MPFHLQFNEDGIPQPGEKYNAQNLCPHRGTNGASGLSHTMSDDQNSSSDEDVALVASWRSGDLSCFEALVLKHQKRLLNIAFRITGVYEDACEVTQDAFLAASRGIDSVQVRGALLHLAHQHRPQPVPEPASATAGQTSQRGLLHGRDGAGRGGPHGS